MLSRTLEKKISKRESKRMFRLIYVTAVVVLLPCAFDRQNKVSVFVVEYISDHVLILLVTYGFWGQI